MAAPRCGNQARVIPTRLNPRAVPTAAVIQRQNKSALIACARALHDVQVVICEQNLRRANGILFVDFSECVDAAMVIRLGEVPVEVILPENAWITFGGEDER